MASILEPSLPSRAQCNALTDDQCRMIQEHLIPYNERLNRDWARPHQPELIRLYMGLQSYRRMEGAMSSRITASGRTYNNRFREWGFPVDRDGRERAVRELYAWVTGRNDGYQSSSVNVPSELAIRSSAPQRLLLPAQPQADATFRPSSSHSVAPFNGPAPAQDRLSAATFNTSTSSGVQSNYTFYNESDDLFSNPRCSTATSATTATNVSSFSSLSAGSQYLPNPLQLPTHDAEHGIWNDVLRVIPCCVNHSALRWHDHFSRCAICGFSRWHALMLSARSMELSDFITAMNNLAHIEQIDFAGNYPIHYLMSAGVGMNYFTILAQHGNTDYQNAFGQNPLHVLNPQDLGEELISFLEWFKARVQPPGLLLTQRDMFGHTPLHMLLQHPFERHMYRKIFDVFPFPAHQLQSFNNKGCSVAAIMMKSAMRIMTESPSAFAKIQAGIAEVTTYTADCQSNLTQCGQEYGIHDIARGDRNGSYYGVNPQCRICGTDDHSNSSFDQLICACAYGRDRNGPDGSGWTPAHALVLSSRCNNDPAHTPETAAQTTELFKILVPADNPNLREILHVVDAVGRSLVYNVSIRGFDEILLHILRLENPVRWKAMVNSCMKTRRGEMVSVLAEVQQRYGEVLRELEGERNQSAREKLSDLAERLLRVRVFLLDAGAELRPDMRTRWQISFV